MTSTSVKDRLRAKFQELSRVVDDLMGQQVLIIKLPGESPLEVETARLMIDVFDPSATRSGAPGKCWSCNRTRAFQVGISPSSTPANDVAPPSRLTEHVATAAVAFLLIGWHPLFLQWHHHPPPGNQSGSRAPIGSMLSKGRSIDAA
eukprot:CAMPEP_0115175384 /NCGR_PEP_ID=MMETSP0270-20121206/4332_1 /TAXON_ID=71861 /ORGANISM="Scrippsiella trochoidea, Strain CCMP3099" /LENGTH=146 /DNA_ID=CAMNT_0002588263 /DNA_START=263 /DNA_END=704 /DNA_ORIENTATION=-